MTRKEELELRAAQWLQHHGDQRLTRPLAALLEQVERGALRNIFNLKKFEQAPCYLCGYNGEMYYQSGKHPCADLYHSVKQQELT